jgi:hypothetical protein
MWTDTERIARSLSRSIYRGYRSWRGFTIGVEKPKGLRLVKETTQEPRGGENPRLEKGTADPWEETLAEPKREDKRVGFLDSLQKEEGIMRNAVRLVVAASIILFLMIATNPMPSGAGTEETAPQEPTEDQIMQMMGPMMGGMMTGMIDAMLAVMAKPETADKLATFTKNYHDALMAKGFSKEEALRIVISVGIPSVPSIK